MPATFRDRFYTRKVANAIVSPSAIVATGTGAAAAILAGFGPIGAVVGGAVFLAARVAAAIPRAPKVGDIDPAKLSEPWRSLVRDALASQRAFSDAVKRALPGPLQDRLATIGEQVSEGVEEVWKTAQAGHTIATAYQHIDTAEIARDLAELSPTDTSPTVASTRAALQAQDETARRMAATVTQTHDQLRLLNARLGEAVTRCIELSAGVYKPSDLDSLEGDVSQVTVEMEALRQAIDVTESATSGAFAAMPAPPQGSSPGVGRTSPGDPGLN